MLLCQWWILYKMSCNADMWKGKLISRFYKKWGVIPDMFSKQCDYQLITGYNCIPRLDSF